MKKETKDNFRSGVITGAGAAVGTTVGFIAGDALASASVRRDSVSDEDEEDNHVTVVSDELHDSGQSQEMSQILSQTDASESSVEVVGSPDFESDDAVQEEDVDVEAGIDDIDIDDDSTAQVLAQDLDMTENQAAFEPLADYVNDANIDDFLA